MSEQQETLVSFHEAPEKFNKEITIRAENVCKSFYDIKKGEVHALKDINFSCFKGEIVGVVGPNGAGKTTLLRIISALLSPTSGKMEVLGIDNTKNPEKNRRHIGFLSGDATLYERLTAEEMITYTAMLHEIPKEEIKEKIQDLSKKLNMQKILKRLCKNLSTGEKQKVSISRAMIHNPEILILDEPTNGLDLITSKDILWLVKTAREDGKTILYSAHNMEEIERISQKIIMVHNGQIIENGTIEEVLERNGSVDLSECFLKLIKYDEPK